MPKPNKKEECKRCGLPQTDWPKGRWENPLCKVGETTYEYHVMSSPPPKEEVRVLKTDLPCCDNGNFWERHDCLKAPKTKLENSFYEITKSLYLDGGHRKILLDFIHSIEKEAEERGVRKGIDATVNHFKNVAIENILSPLNNKKNHEE